MAVSRLPGHRPADPAATRPDPRPLPGRWGAMIRTRGRRRHEAQLLADLNDLLRPAPRAGVLGIVWRWRYELALLAGAAMAVTALLLVLGGAWTVITVSALLGTFGPPWHETQIAAAWRIVTPHRLRSGFTQAHIRSGRGRLPLVVRTTSEPFGERVTVWCPAGTSAEDLQSARALLRAACWAADVRIIPGQRHSHLVTVEVIRKGPFRPGAHHPSPHRPSPGAPGHPGAGTAGPGGPTLPPAPDADPAPGTAPAAGTAPAPGTAPAAPGTTPAAGPAVPGALRIPAPGP